jgi:hypothetical protein
VRLTEQATPGSSTPVPTSFTKGAHGAVDGLPANFVKAPRKWRPVRISPVGRHTAMLKTQSDEVFLTEVGKPGMPPVPLAGHGGL